MRRILPTLALSVVSGVLICLCVPILVIVLNTNWSDPPIPIVSAETRYHLGVLAALGAVNGAVGMCVGWCPRGRGYAPVLVVPLPLLFIPLMEYFEAPQATKTWVPDLIVFGLVGLLVWFAGRVGQHFGAKAVDAKNAAKGKK